MKGRRGAVTLEFTLVGIPLLFTLISTVEMSRGMWMYQTQAYAISQGVRYLVVHGADCQLERKFVYDNHWKHCRCDRERRRRVGARAVERDADLRQRRKQHKL